MKSSRFIEVVAFFIFISSVALADDSEYSSVRDNIFWPLLYKNNYETLYCAEFKPAGERVTIEHVYPADWIAKAQGCTNRDSCDVELYRLAGSDLHNLWPALQRYNSSRGNLPYGVISGEEQRFPEDDCDFERTSGANAIVEPRDAVKGQIARSILYMISSYNLPERGQLEIMDHWNKSYPPNDFEKARNEEIAKLQSGQRNPFIDFWNKP